MDHISTMLGDIHEWFLDNLQGKPPGGSGAPTFGVANAPTFGAANAPTFGVASAATFGAASGPSGGTPGDNPGTPSAVLHFELHEQQHGQGTKEICPRVMLSQKISGAYYSASLRSNQLFSCGCDSGLDAHRSAVDAYACRFPPFRPLWMVKLTAAASVATKLCCENLRRGAIMAPV